MILVYPLQLSLVTAAYYTYIYIYILPSFTFELFLSQNIKHISYRQCIVRSCFCFSILNSAHFLLRIRVFNPFIFHVIPDEVRLYICHFPIQFLYVVHFILFLQSSINPCLLLPSFQRIFLIPLDFFHDIRFKLFFYWLLQ